MVLIPPSEKRRGSRKVLGHISTRTPETEERQERWQEAYRAAEREGQLAVDDIKARHGRFFEGRQS
jgi:hypothetical protein